MKRHISFPSIEQFRSVITNINRQFNFVGLDVNGDPIYDYALPKPVLTFKGTVKLHGTNAGVCYNNVGGFWAQSRENIITPVQDNAGFAFFAESNKNEFMGLFNQIKDENNIDLDNNTISIFGEWAGGNIQRGVGIAGLDKSFFIFGVKISPFTTTTERDIAYWVDCTTIRNTGKRIFNVNDYDTYTIDIDFNMPQLVQNDLCDITIGVENECPIAKAFGLTGIGEGVVWTCELGGTVFRFKVKGMKHSSSKVKTLASVDVEKLNSIKEFVDYSVTESRFNQALEKVFNGSPIDVTKMGDLIRWVVADVTKEEMETMVSNKIDPKDVNKFVSAKVREMFFKLV